jgi:hypothetical protein
VNSMAASQSRKTTSAKAAAVQYPRPKLACSRGSLVQCDQHPRVDFSTKEPHRRDKSRSTLSLLFTFLAHNYYINHNLLCAPTHLLRYRASACRSFVCRLSAAILHYALLRRIALSRAFSTTSLPSRLGLIQPAGSHTHLAASRRFWNRPPTQRRHKRPTCKRGTAA